VNFIQIHAVRKEDVHWGDFQMSFGRFLLGCRNRVVATVDTSCSKTLFGRIGLPLVGMQHFRFGRSYIVDASDSGNLSNFREQLGMGFCVAAVATECLIP
jgi:hypothetical protein